MESIKEFGSIINGEEIIRKDYKNLEVVNPFNNQILANVCLSTKKEMNTAIEGAYNSYHDQMKKMPIHLRASILNKAADLIENRVDEFAKTLSLEAGKPIKDARLEVNRAIQVIRFASNEAKTIEGELLPMDAAIGGENRIGMVRKIPIGVIAAITPFNFPLNLVLHKIAPAIATGNTLVLKPALKTPLSAIKLVNVFYEAGLPKNALQLLLAKGSEIGDYLITDNRISKVTFTGSPEVGKSIKNKVGLKRITLELGSNSPNIIFDDVDIDKVIKKLVNSSFGYAGQVCISSQRIFVHENILERFSRKFVEHVEQLKTGDPINEQTDIGPLISEESFERIENWIAEAVNSGAKILTGGKRIGNQILKPTIITNVKNDMKIVCKEAFAPIVNIIPFSTEDEVILAANDSEFGLQAGIFTQNINRALKISESLESGGVWINEVSSYRQDNYPYGGIKNSGFGKEGVKYAMKDMLEEKFIGINLN